MASGSSDGKAREPISTGNTRTRRVRKDKHNIERGVEKGGLDPVRKAGARLKRRLGGSEKHDMRLNPADL